MRAEVKRPIITKANDGTILSQSWRKIVPEHDIDLLALSHRERFVGDQLQIKISHSIVPQLRNTDSINLGDFFITENDEIYNIVEKVADADFTYFRVLYDDSGLRPGSNGISRTCYQLDSLTAASYTFGSSPFTNMPSFDSVPVPFFTRRNLGDYYIPSLTSSGFVLADKGAGASPLVDARIYEYSTAGDGGIWMFDGLSVGTYQFGIGDLAGMPPAIFPEPDIFLFDQTGTRLFVYEKSTTGFTLYPSGAGFGDPLATVVIFEKPDVGENRWAIEGLTPAAYTFGEGVLANVKGFSSAPDIYSYNTNRGDHYFPTISATGFVLADAGVEMEPVVNIVVVKA